MRNEKKHVNRLGDPISNKKLGEISCIVLWCIQTDQVRNLDIKE